MKELGIEPLQLADESILDECVLLNGLAGCPRNVLLEPSERVQHVTKVENVRQRHQK